MKHVTSTILASFVLFFSSSSFANSYHEKTLATCGSFKFLEVELGTQQVDGSLTSETSYLIRFKNGVEMPAEKNMEEDLDKWKVTTSENSSIVLSKSTQSGVSVYDWVQYQEGAEVQKGSCHPRPPVIFY